MDTVTLKPAATTGEERSPSEPEKPQGESSIKEPEVEEARDDQAWTALHTVTLKPAVAKGEERAPLKPEKLQDESSIKEPQAEKPRKDKPWTPLDTDTLKPAAAKGDERSPSEPEKLKEDRCYYASYISSSDVNSQSNKKASRTANHPFESREYAPR